MLIVINPGEYTINLDPGEEYSFTPGVDVSLEVSTYHDVLYQFIQDTGNWSVLEGRDHLIVPSGKLLFLRSGNYVSRIGRTDIS